MTEPILELLDVTQGRRPDGTPVFGPLDLRLQPGETVVVVGPAGAGKSTLLRTINRLVAPATSGQVRFEGRDTATVDAHGLRQRIGFVTHRDGLFPARTVGENVATVPDLLGWSDDRIDAAVADALHLVGLDPSNDAEHFPNELAPADRLRAALARAMAATPPLLLLDSPFRELPPAQRARLQNEFLRWRDACSTAVLFVTRDIDEAIKLGHRIVVLDSAGRCRQVGTPEQILDEPADADVEAFIGAGAMLKRLRLSRVTDVEILTDCPTGSLREDPDELRARLDASDWTALLLLDDHGRPLRWLRTTDFLTNRPLEALGLPVVATVEPQATLSEALEEMLAGSAGVAVVIDGRGRYQGLVDLEALIGALRASRDQQVAFFRAAKLVDPTSDA